MDPLTSLVTALAAGATAALQSTVEQVVEDSYAALKGLIQRKYAQVDVNQIEANPTSKNRRGVVEEELAAAGADKDAEVLQYAQALLEAIQHYAPQTAAAIGVDLQDIEGASLAIRRVIATGAGVKVEGAKLSGDITIEDIRAGGRRGASSKRRGAAGPVLAAHLEHVSAGGDITIYLPGISAEQYQHLTNDLGVTQSLLNTFVKILQRERIPVEQRAQELNEIAKAHQNGELLERQAQRLQVRAVELIREGNADRAFDELREGESILTALFNESPADVKLHAQLGYFYKTMAQAFDEAGNRKRADQFLARADHVFQLIKEHIPADSKTAADMADAINGLGNVHYQRGEFEKAIENYRLAVTLNPAYAYAWHDLFGAYVALAQRGNVELVAMRHALQQVKETGAGLPGLGADYIVQLEAHLHRWEQATAVLDQRDASRIGQT